MICNNPLHKPLHAILCSQTFAHNPLMNLCTYPLLTNHCTNLCTYPLLTNHCTNLCSQSSSPILFTQSFVHFYAAKSLCSFVDTLPNFLFPTYFSIPYSFLVFDNMSIASHIGRRIGVSRVFHGCFTGVSQVFTGIYLGTRTIHRDPRSNHSPRPFAESIHRVPRSNLSQYPHTIPSLNLG